MTSRVTVYNSFPDKQSCHLHVGKKVNPEICEHCMSHLPCPRCVNFSARKTCSCLGGVLEHPPSNNFGQIGGYWADRLTCTNAVKTVDSYTHLSRAQSQAWWFHEEHGGGEPVLFLPTDPSFAVCSYFSQRPFWLRVLSYTYWSYYWAFTDPN